MIRVGGTGVGLLGGTAGQGRQIIRVGGTGAGLLGVTSDQGCQIIRVDGTGAGLLGVTSDQGRQIPILRWLGWRLLAPDALVSGPPKQTSALIDAPSKANIGLRLYVLTRVSSFRYKFIRGHVHVLWRELNRCRRMRFILRLARHPATRTSSRDLIAGSRITKIVFTIHDGVRTCCHVARSWVNTRGCFAICLTVTVRWVILGL